MKKHLFLLILILMCVSSQIVYGQSKSKRSGKSDRRLSRQSYYDCLPEGIELDTVISVIRKKPGLPGEVEREDAKRRLNKMNARCRSGRLVDQKNREIRFYRLQGCWGNPPGGYREILKRQQEELDELKKKYSVIEITCNPSGEMPF